MNLDRFQPPSWKESPDPDYDEECEWEKADRYNDQEVDREREDSENE